MNANWPTLHGLAAVGILGMIATVGGAESRPRARGFGAPATSRPAATQPAYLDPAHGPKGKGWIALCNGKDLTGWKPRQTDRPMSWKLVDGVMVNTSTHESHGVDIYTENKFDDFEMYYEYRIPKDSNSGVYLRGRYEIQILDDYGQEPAAHSNGAVYNKCPPAKNVSKKPGEWQSVYARIVGRKITVVLNGTKVVNEFEVPGPTGGEIDNKERQPGPIMIQGDHGSIEVRHLNLRPIAKG